MRFIVCVFAFLAFAFYQLSGGADFDPVETRLARVDVTEPEPTAATRIAQAESTLPQTPIITPVKLNLTPQKEPVEELTEEVVASATPGEADLDEEPPAIILPSLIQTIAVVTPVSFADDATEAESAPDTSALKIRSVTGNRVNVRGGPGTTFSVVTQLVRGDEVEILEDPGQGWVQLRPLNGGPIGWTADFLLSEG